MAGRRPRPHDRPGRARVRRRARRRMDTGRRGRGRHRGAPGVRLARRIETLPPYLFAELDRKVAARRAAGADVISLGVGDPDLPTPPHVVEALRKAAVDTSTHRYPSYYGLPELRQAIASFYERR